MMHSAVNRLFTVFDEFCLEMDFLCRICIKKGTKYTPINTKIENSPSLTFLDFLNKCTSLNACENDKLPQRLCPMCTNSMKTFYAFVKLAQQSDIILKEALTNVIAKGGFNDNGEICEEIPIRNEKIKKEPEDVSKEDSFHCQPNENSTGSSLYILDIVKEEPRISEGTSIVDVKDANKINESETLHSTLDHPEWSLDELGDMLSYADRGIVGTDAEYSDSEDDVPISLLKRSCAKNKDETSYSHSNLCAREHCGSSYMQQTTDKIKAENGEEFKEGALDPQVHVNYHKRITAKCNHCDKEFKHRRILSGHMRLHTNPFKCENCGKLFAWKYHYTQHIEFCKRPGEPQQLNKTKIECGICGKQFSTKEYLAIHLNYHKGLTLNCNQCGKEYKNRTALKIHMESHNETIQKCNQCGREYASIVTLRRHMEWHADPKQFKCEICGKFFATKQNYTRHVNLHVNPKPFKCKNCGKSFARSYVLDKHRNICKRPGEPQEINKTKASCEICGKKFRKKVNLILHMGYHMGISQKCDQCGKEFKRTDTLRRHLKWHANPKPFKCKNCGNSFARKNLYTNHMKLCKPLANSIEEAVAIEN